MSKAKVLFLSQQKLLRKSSEAAFRQVPEFEYLPPVKDPQEAIDEIHLHKPDVVLIDLNPSLSGLRVSYQLHAACPGCKIIVLASRLTASTKVQLALTGVRGVLTKDIGMDTLVWAIREACNGSVCIGRKEPGLPTIWSRVRVRGRSPLVKQRYWN